MRGVHQSVWHVLPVMRLGEVHFLARSMIRPLPTTRTAISAEASMKLQGMYLYFSNLQWVLGAMLYSRIGSQFLSYGGFGQQILAQKLKTDTSLGTARDYKQNM